MNSTVIGILIPFIGTTFGSACVFFAKKNINRKTERILTGFASGVMIAACIWSLILPAMEQSKQTMGELSFVPAVIGYWLGILFLLVIDKSIPHLHLNADKPEGPKTSLSKVAMMILAVTIHNIPEGMAVGAVYAVASTTNSISIASAFSLALGIAIQNFPEGAIISLPLHAEGVSKSKSFLYGMLSGIVEPLAALLTIALANVIQPFMPILLSFAAGAMMYVVVEELIPEMSEGEHSNIGTMFFAVGFTLMMVLDVIFG